MLDLGSALNFDLDDLSGEEWGEKTSYVYIGSAPQIATQIVSKRNNSYLAVQFYDEDNDIVLAAYADGSLATEDFDGGEIGNAIELNQTGIVTYEATAETYTFYALDSKGNETVKVVEITENKITGITAMIGSYKCPVECQHNFRYKCRYRCQAVCPDKIKKCPV